MSIAIQVLLTRGFCLCDRREHNCHFNLEALGVLQLVRPLPTAPANPNFDILNLQAFLYGPQDFHTPQQIIYKDRNNQYLIIGGDIWVAVTAPGGGFELVNVSAINIFFGHMLTPDLGQLYRDFANELYSRG